jgi:O-succinylbenzoic acid--CoA ligase
MIISGGENIHLEEIERALLALPGVKSVSVGKRFDEEFGERPTATLWINQEMEKEKIRQSLEKSLPRYKIPYLEDLFLHRYQEPMENLSKRFWN